LHELRALVAIAETLLAVPRQPGARCDHILFNSRFRAAFVSRRV
jgi:hypothetical protein